MSHLSKNPLPDLIIDLQLRQQKLGKQMKDFMTLQQEIVILKQKAPQDISAQQRLARLASAMQGELGNLNAKFSQDMESLKENMAQLEAALQGTEKSTEQSVAVRKTPSSVRLGFI